MNRGIAAALAVTCVACGQGKAPADKPAATGANVATPSEKTAAPQASPADAAVPAKPIAPIGWEQAWKELERPIEKVTSFCPTFTAPPPGAKVVVPEEVGQLVGVHYLCFQDAGIDELPAVIATFPELTTLVLRGNKITQLPDGFLDRAMALREIDVTGLALRGSDLAALADASLDRGLEVKGLGGWFTNVDEAVRAGDGAVELDLEGQDPIGKLAPATLAKLKTLRVLRLGGQKLTAIPATIGQLTELRVLSVSGNRLTALPPEVGSLAHLRTLEAAENKITAVPPAIGGLGELRILDLFGNALTALPPELGGLKRLHVLDVEENPALAELPAELFTLPELAILAADPDAKRPESAKEKRYNSIQGGEGYGSDDPPAMDVYSFTGTLVSDVRRWPELREVHYDALESFPIDVLDTPKLRVLHIDGSIAGGGERTVYHSVGDVPDDIGTLTRLRELSLTMNKLSHLPSSIGRMTRLRRLDLRHNRFSKVPAVVFKLPALRELCLDDNRIKEADLAELATKLPNVTTVCQ